MVVADPVPVIQATLAPVFLVSGGSIFLNFLQARLFRINDRIRVVAQELSAAAEGAPRAALQAILAGLATRQLIIRNAILLGVGSILLTMLTTILIIAPAVTSARVPAGLTVTVFALALVTFAAALGLALRDTLLSVRLVGDEVLKG